MIDAHSECVIITDRHDVNAGTWLKGHMPVILRNTRYHMVGSERPPRSYTAVFYPNIGIVLPEAHTRFGVLNKDTGVRLLVVMHNGSLIADAVLNSQCR